MSRCEISGVELTPATEGTYEIGPKWLTKREWFAGLILQGMAANDAYANIAVETGRSPADFRVGLAIEYADKLIAELEK